MPALSVIESPVAMHLAINVTDLEQSVAFYRVLFGTEPAKCYADYAKFEVADPPIVFSLVASSTTRGGVMSHLGLRLTSECAIRAVQRRLKEAGYLTREQNETRGCYAVQTKVWVDDPDQNQWEVYILTEDLPGGDVMGCRPSHAADDDAGTDRGVVYKGPFRELDDGEGHVFPRGELVTVPAGVWEALRQGPAADQFVFTLPSPVVAPVPVTTCSEGCR